MLDVVQCRYIFFQEKKYVSKKTTLFSVLFILHFYVPYYTLFFYTILL